MGFSGRSLAIFDLIRLAFIDFNYVHRNLWFIKPINIDRKP